MKSVKQHVKRKEQKPEQKPKLIEERIEREHIFADDEKESEQDEE